MKPEPTTHPGTGRSPSIPVTIFDTAEQLGEALATRILAGVELARARGSRFVLGCPSGRSTTSTLAALAHLASGADLSNLVVAMMDEYLVQDAGGGWVRVPAELPHSCLGYGIAHVSRPLAASGFDPANLWQPDPADPAEFERRLQDAGGIDLFLLASGASDGHVALNPRGCGPDEPTRIVELLESTRRDNMATFPSFASIDEVPTRGVTVGTGTISRLSRAVAMILTSADKQTAYRRITGTDGYDPDWPATIVHACRRPHIYADRAAVPTEEN